LAVTDVALFRDAYGPLLNQNLLVPAPVEPPTTRHSGQLSNKTQASQEAALEQSLSALEALLVKEHTRIAAFIVEPLVQGAAGMRFYPAAYLARARELCSRYQIHLIADEIMVGFGRTGSLFACEQIDSPQGQGLEPDFLCLSKGITGGYLPLSCVLTRDNIYQAFYSDDISRGFLHSHSYTGSALACRAALATLDIFEEDNVINQNRAKAARFNAIAAPLAAHPRVSGYRQIGMIWAFEVASSAPHFARDFFGRALARGILLRPIGHTVYFMPPYIISDEEFAWLVAETIHILDQLPAP
ncbi:MAG: aminotransferase class III-fold pyridoxal phosphate-dependent enzyme, partial [Betaproteobacteria bacterium]|nr:aminotransferase class III-fold pyridoxal phosphate-dependent enzyme [Betaproteobacteria bacterium]